MTRTLAALLATVAAVATSDIAAQGPIVRDGTGRVLGYYVGPAQLIPLGVRVMSQQGYFFGIAQNGEVMEDVVNPNGAGQLFRPNSLTDFTGLWFQSSDCTGQPYFSFAQAGSWAAGVVVKIGKALYYTPPWTFPEPQPFFNSRGDGGTFCVPLNNVRGDFSVPALPNNPDVTGVPNDPIQPPIRIVAGGNVNALFADSFEERA